MSASTDSFGLLPRTRYEHEADAYENGDVKAFDVADAEERIEARS